MPKQHKEVYKNVNAQQGAQPGQEGAAGTEGASENSGEQEQTSESGNADSVEDVDFEVVDDDEETK